MQMPLQQTVPAAQTSDAVSSVHVLRPNHVRNVNTQRMPINVKH